MTITVELTPKVRDYLRARAKSEGRDEAAVAQELLELFVDHDADEEEQALAGIRRGLADFEAGRFRSAAEVHAGLRDITPPASR